MKRFLKIIFVLLTLLLAGWFLAGKFLSKGSEKIITTGNKISQEVLNNIESNIPSPAKNPNTSPGVKYVLQNVPFTSQAPFANWQDPIYQNACEEASVLMAMAWVQGRTLAPQIANDEIKAIAGFEVKKFGHSFDTSTEDTLKIIDEYYNYPNAEAKTGITVTDIVNELMAGNVVLVPADGQRLGNPYYTAPGPITHMLVIIGYDPGKREFITNDASTKRGEKYRYNENVLFNAIWHYPTGDQHTTPPDPSVAEKAMIIVRPK